MELFRLKFAVINDRMRMIQHMALEQRGRIFVRHVHSVAELFGSAHFAKIESIAGKIADDVHQWRLQGALSDHGLIFYEQYRQQMEERLEDLQETIRRRRPTLWESTAEVIVGFAQRVMSAIPAVDTLSRLISGPAPTRLLLSGRSGKA